jgi:ABC-type antimicrobial peptide transport system permease subunit
MAPLQKRALYSLVIGLVLTISLIAVLVVQGDVTAFDRDPNLRLIMYAVLIGVPLVYLILVNLSLRKPTQVDERDRLIIERSSRTQWLAVIFSLVAWTITLTEIYRDQGQVPVAFLNLIFMSTLIISTLAQSLGILLGYWRINRNG